ncbi:MAG: N-acetylmuramoyl-L-alanine amidase [Lachnospiraceae bacterium]|nr:N-acetylmuramoyl-L-alanine amidase [Lachnospiraceae bacterium]
MYGESSFTWEYVCGYETREQRKRRLSRRVCTLAAAVCIVSLTVTVSVKLAAAGGARFLAEKLWGTEEGLADLPFDGNGAGVIQAEQIVAPLAAVTIQTTVPDQDESTLPVVAHIPTVYLDPGHGGADEGCAREGVLEKDLNLAIALLVRDQLIEQGYQVIMSRETDTYITKETRVEEANRSGADIYISIHQNATEDGAGVSGMEVWYTEDGDRSDSKRLAQLIRQQTLKSTGAVDRELRSDADFYVTGNTAMPACLIETGFLSNTAERKKLGLAEYQQQIADGIVQGISYYFYPKTMYLTFDDGPSEENTRKVLDILRERNIKATFFLVGENVRKHPEVARQIVAEGHTIGIHCDNHDYEALYESVDSYVADFEKARQTVYEVTGVETNLFRFPGGSVNAYNQKTGSAIIREMTDRGYIYYDWNASLEDAVKNPDPKQLVENGVSTTLGRKKVVLLAHDVVGSTCLCLEELLDSLPEYKMEPLSEDVEPICF